MAQQELGELLGSKTAKVLAVLQDVQALSQNVGTQPFKLVDRELSVQPGDLEVFRNQKLQISASTSVALQIHPPGRAVQAFESADSAGEGVKAPADRSFAELQVSGRFGVDGQAATHPAGVLTLAIGLKSGAEMTYRHLLPVRADRPRAEAFRKVLTQSRLPQLADFAKLEPGEIHELTSFLYLDLGAKLSAGGDASFVGDLFRDLPSQIDIHVQYLVEASLGLSVYERMRITSGRAHLLDPGRVRLRVERESRRRLTFGARFALQVRYDLTAGLESLLEEALQLLPLPRSIETLRAVAAEMANSDAEQIKDRLRATIGAEITEFIGSRDWEGWNSRQVLDFVALSNQVVEAYTGLGERLQSLWDRLLGRADLGQGSNARTLLTRLRQLDPQHPEQLLDAESRDLIEAVEILSGQSLEEILLASGTSPALQEVRDLAGKALGFLESAPRELLTRFQSFAERTGIKKAVDWLRTNATSVEQLKSAADAQVRKLAEQLAGKTLDQISTNDFNRIRRWAQRIGPVLAAPAEIEAKLRSRVARLKGEAGLSVALEIDRASRTTAVLDLEFDPRDDDTRQALEKIGQRDLGALLRDLPGGGEDPAQAETFPYQIRECVFTSERTRSSAVNLFFSLLGWTRGSRRLVEESVARISQSGSAFTREGVYGGASVQSSEDRGALSSSAVWLTSRARGTGKDLAAAYGKVERELRLTFSREDEKTTPEELDSLGILLNNLGFDPLPPDHPRNHVLGSGAGPVAATRFAIDIRLPERAVTAFWSDRFDTSAGRERWMLDLLNGLHRWFDEPLVPAEIDLDRMRPVGLVLSRALREPEVRDAWLASRSELDTFASSHVLNMKIDNAIVPVRLARREPTGFINWLPLFVLPISRSHAGNALKPLRAAEQQVGAAGKRPEDLAALSRSAGESLLAFQPHPSKWSNPMLGIWTVVSRLSRLAPEALREAEGIATLRWKDASGNWPAAHLRTWTLKAGVMVHDRAHATGMFPIVK